MRATRSGTAAITRRIGGAAAVVALAAAVLLFVLRPLSIVLPAGGLDSSWMVVLGEAATHSARWGVDLAFTYGPASALVTRYFTDGYLADALPILAAIGVVSGACMLRLAQIGAMGRRFGVPMILLAVVAWMAGLAAELAQDQDAFYFALGLALFLLDLVRRPGDRVGRATVMAGAALMGVMALGKTSYGILALGLFILADLRAALAGSRAPVLTFVILMAFLAAFTACGQHLGDLPAYLRLQGQVAAGYGEAMYLPPRRAELFAFLSGAAALVAVAGLCGAPGRAGRLLPAVGTAFTLAIALKAGFIRADTHPQIGWSLLGLAGLGVGAGLVMRRSPAGAAALGTASLLVLWVVGPLFLLADTDRRPSLGAIPQVVGDMGGQLAAESAGWARFLRSPAAFADAARHAKAEAWNAVRTAEPLPRLAGGVDILPSEQTAVLANGLDYHPRPSFQEYSTYTAGLIAANGAFYAGPDAPRWVVFGAGGLDDRYPTSTEGALWPELLRLYEPVRRVGPWIGLRRRTDPLPDVLGPPVRVDARLGERVAVPGTGPVFARIVVRETFLGRLAAAVFRPSALSLRVTLADGGEQSYRFIPAIAAGGFLVSPLLTDADGFAKLGLGTGDDVDGPVVTGILVGGSRWAKPFYDAAVSVEFRPVMVKPGPPSPDALALSEDLARGLAWRRLVRSLGQGAKLDGDHLSVPAPTALTVPVGGARRLGLRFGIEDGAWREGRTQGVCFAVKASPDAVAPLWRRCLDPRDVPADRGSQSVEVEVPSGTTTVVAATTCPKSCDWGWSYWSGIASEP